MLSKKRKWFRGLAGGVIGSAASNLAAALGLGAASSMGVKVTALDLKQLGVLFVAGAISGAVLFLKQSPIPPAEDETEPPFPK